MTNVCCPPNALIIAAVVLSAISAVCIILSRPAPRQEGALKIKPAFLKFVGEQDGPRERMLKSALVQFFQGAGIVQKAYLARLDIGEGPTVGLCLKANPLPDESYPDRIAELFIRVMGPGGSLDVLFLKGGQETDLARVCKPFYERTRSA
jgi:hypothetical protein